MEQRVVPLSKTTKVRNAIGIVKDIITVYLPHAAEGEKLVLKRAQSACASLERMLSDTPTPKPHDLVDIVMTEADLAKELQEDWQDLRALGPGWAGCGEDEGAISDEAIAATAFVLLACFVLDHLPTDMVGSPLQSVNLKWKGCTLIVLGREDIRMFDEEECTVARHSLSHVFALMRGRSAKWTGGAVVDDVAARLFEGIVPKMMGLHAIEKRTRMHVSAHAHK